MLSIIDILSFKNHKIKYEAISPMQFSLANHVDNMPKIKKLLVTKLFKISFEKLKQTIAKWFLCRHLLLSAVFLQV